MLEILLRGQQLIVLCPARNIERLRLPTDWRQPYKAGRLLVLSPFAVREQRPTATLAEHRNRFVATLAASILVAYAGPGSRTAQLCAELVSQHRRVYTLDLPENTHLMQPGVLSSPLHDLGALLRHPQGDHSAITASG